MQLLRTPDKCFENIGFDFEPHYSTVNAPDGTKIRVHHVDEGPRDGEVLVCLHGEPSWSFLYRKVIPIWVAGGYRVIAFDLVGFGKSDKPADSSELTYARQVDWTAQWLAGLGLNAINLVCHDWGGMIGMRLVAADMDHFKRLILGNTLLFDTSHMPAEVSAQLQAAHSSIPVAEREQNTEVWQQLGRFANPVLTVFSDSDPVTAGHEAFFQDRIPGAKGVQHVMLEGIGHYLQDESPDAFGAAVLEFLRST